MLLFRRLSATAKFALGLVDIKPNPLIAHQVMKHSIPLLSVSLSFFLSLETYCCTSDKNIVSSRILFKGTSVYIDVSSETDLRESLDSIKHDIHVQKKVITNIIFKTKNRPLILFAEGKFVPSHSRPNETLNDLIRNLMIQEAKSFSGISFVVVDVGIANDKSQRPSVKK